MNLVTGATGHLGNVLVRELVSRSEPVRALVLPGEDLRSLEGLPIEIVEGNVLDLPSLISACQGVDTVFHLAGLVSILEEHEPILRKVNVEGTRNVIQAVLQTGVRRLVYTSSIHALTRPPHGVLIQEDLPFDPQNPAGAYDRTKAEASILVLEAVQRDGLDAVIVCPTGVIGPYDYRRSEVGEMILNWMTSRLDYIVKGGFDFVDVRDVARGHILARDYGIKGHTYILGGEQISVTQLRALVKEIRGLFAPALEFPKAIAFWFASLAEIYYKVTHTRPKFTRYSIETLLSNSQISIQRAKTELGYAPRKLSETLRDTIAWWLEHFRKTRKSVRI
ncbi:SDR family oxidoreductase [Anaerolinea thermophila]|uniref:NAD-dependent epimerase/dehydratase family protein n=1 Tax=Anaerolinea thermophila (strain DSM 14523 / JCM 11388 / NBRC 100420 / UNI-1) TaxID=926569 RepID=E8N5S5_ANATU|nr:SDR family oxidoreductase [Anaerolinea thermophila]BAJ63789.1 NAD-dependent epimerase/dehydratase family protein [Anaerolinea thermophila UNI-1]